MRKIRFALFALFAFLIVFVTSLTSCGTDDILNPDSYDPDGPIVLEEAFNVKGVKFVMVAVEGGTFMMGATSEQKESYYVLGWTVMLRRCLNTPVPRKSSQTAL